MEGDFVGCFGMLRNIEGELMGGEEKKMGGFGASKEYCSWM